MNSRILLSIVFLAIFICTSCWGPRKTPEEENILKMLSTIQSSLESETNYEQFLQLVDQLKTQIDILKGQKKANPCLISSLDKCLASYKTSAKAWEQKRQATDEIRKQDMDLTLSVLKSFSAISVQRAINCFKK